MGDMNLSIGEEFSTFFIVLFLPALVHLCFMMGYQHK